MFRVFKESLGILSLASTLLYTSVHMITQASRWFNLQHFSESKMRHISLYFTQHFLIHFVSITRWQLSYFPWFCSGKNSCRIPLIIGTFLTEPNIFISESLHEYFLCYYNCYFSSVLWDNLIINQPCISIEERVGYESLSPIFFEFKVKNSLHFCGIGYNRNVKNFWHFKGGIRHEKNGWDGQEHQASFWRIRV